MWLQFGQEANTPKVDTQNRDINTGTDAGGINDGAISAQNNCHLATFERRIKTVITLITNVNAAYRVPFLLQDRHKLSGNLGGSIFPSLVKYRNCLHYTLSNACL